VAGDAEPRERITVEVGGKRLEVTVPAGLGTSVGGGGGTAGPAGAAGARPKSGARRGGTAGGAQTGDELVSPMQGTIVKIVAADGEQVSAGDTIVVLEAMKMEQPLTAHKAGTVTGLSISVGQTVPAGAVICQLR
jgi:acetyl-CoA/propionyl-CoA carboxylase biotin carboxyl carrier protein